MSLLECAYLGEPTDAMEDAFAAIVIRHRGEFGDSGWCSNERDTSAKFDSVSEAQRKEITAELKARGFTWVDWS